MYDHSSQQSFCSAVCEINVVQSKKDMVADMKVDMVPDMKVDMVADMKVDMVAKFHN